MFRQKFLSNQVAQTKLWRENKYRKKWREIITKKILQRNLHEKSQKNNFRPNKFWRETSSKKYLKRNFLPRSFRREITSKKYVTKFSAKKSLKKDIPCQKFGRRNLHEKKSKHFWQNLFDNFSTKNSLKRNLCQTIFGSNPYRKSIGRIISTTNSLKGNLYKTIFKRNPYQKIFQEKIYKTNIYRKVFTKTMS